MAKLRTTSLLLSCRACGGVFWTKDTRQHLCDECTKYLGRKRLRGYKETKGDKRNEGESK